MDKQNRGYLYPDPSEAYVSPYVSTSSAYAATGNAAYPFQGYSHLHDDGHIPQSPLVHEGFVPNSAHEYDNDAIRYEEEEEEEESGVPSGGLQFEYAPRRNPWNVRNDSENRINIDGSLSWDDQQDAHQRMIDPDFYISNDEDRSPSGIPERSESPADAVLQGEGRRGAKRGRPRGRGRGGVRGGLKLLMQMTDPDFRRGRGGARGRPRSSRAKAEAGVRRGGGKAKRGPRAAIDPGAEYKRFQDQATLAYLRGDLEDALEYARQAVQQNPEIFASH
ncbi:transcription factor TFIIIC subunit tfc4, partial [Cryomyces antarcticus]